MELAASEYDQEIERMKDELMESCLEIKTK